MEIKKYTITKKNMKLKSNENTMKNIIYVKQHVQLMEFIIKTQKGERKYNQYKDLMKKKK